MFTRAKRAQKTVLKRNERQLMLASKGTGCFCARTLTPTGYCINVSRSGVRQPRNPAYFRAKK